MKSGEAAKLLGVDPKTLANWIDRDELRKYFSPTARKEGINQRIFTETDFAILNTIRHMTVNGRAGWADVAALIEAGELQRDIPENAAFPDSRMVPEQQVRESMRAVATVTERDQLALQMQGMQERINELEMRLQNEQNGRREDVERLLREVAAAQVAQREAETMLKLFESGRLKPAAG